MWDSAHRCRRNYRALFREINELELEKVPKGSPEM
jgi:hypothetical protein